MIGYGVWSKQDMIEWLLRGVAEHADEAAEVVFLFDGCLDDSEKNFDELAPVVLNDHARVTKLVNKIETYEIGCHFQLMRYFMDYTNCDVLILPQDDQRFTGPILQYIYGVIDAYGDNVGVIGGRDGYDLGLQNMMSSAWSESQLAPKRLIPGEFVERPYVNPGPMVFTRTVIETVGYYNMDFWCWYWWNDYCHRCQLAGFTNILLGIDIQHLKFGKVPEQSDGKSAWNSTYKNGSQVQDAVLIDGLWGRIGLAG